MLATAAITSSDSDPEPDLPDCYRDREYVEGLIRGMSGAGPRGEPTLPTESAVDSTTSAVEDELRSWNCLVRTYVATNLACSEPRPDGRRALICATSTNAQLCFRGRWLGLDSEAPQAVLPVPSDCRFHVSWAIFFAAAKAGATGAAARCEMFQGWAEACWQDMFTASSNNFRRYGQPEPLPDGDVERLAEDDPRRILSQEIGYLEHNQERMNYPMLSPAGIALDQQSHGVDSEALQQTRQRLREVLGDNPEPSPCSN